MTDKLESLSRREFLDRTLKGTAEIGLMYFLSGCSDEQPKLKNPVTYTGIPRKIVEMIESYKGGSRYVSGIRIEFDDFIATTNHEGIYGQQGLQIVGLGTVRRATVKSFRKIADLCEEIKDKEEITMAGAKAIRKGKDFYFEGKPVIFLYEAIHVDGQGKEVRMEVDRRHKGNAYYSSYEDILWR